jgi:hypothetical protein
MANTFELIASSTVGALGAANIDFTSIPSIYTDLCLKMSLRTDKAAIDGPIFMNINGVSTNRTMIYLEGNGASASSGSASSANISPGGEGASATSNTFASIDLYLPNYSNTSYNKSFSVDSVGENNATTIYADLLAGLWSQTAAINQLTLSPQTGNFVQYSTAYLYGIKNS